MMNKNILILSCGTRNTLIRYFKESLYGLGKVHAADANPLSPALYEADEYHVIPKIDAPSYLDTIINICITNNIKAVLTLIDPELMVLAKNRGKFVNVGVLPIVSSLSTINLFDNKYKMYKTLRKKGINTVQSYIDKDEFYREYKKGIIDFPVFVKPINGSASININKARNMDELEQLFSRNNNLMIQEHMDGREYGIDAYIDMHSNELISVFIKQKLKMRSGETDKSVSVINNKLKQFVVDFINLYDFKGVLDIDVFEKNGEFYISEVNPRFGGGYPHAYNCGVNIPKMIVNNLNKTINKSECDKKYSPGIYMMKYSDVLMRH